MADLPIALRRTRRSTSSLSTAFHGGAPADVPTPPLTPSSSSPSSTLSGPSGPSTPSSRKTPSRRRAPASKKRDAKRVRFSDPGPRLASSSPVSGCNCSTGLTPFIRRTSLQSGLPVSGDVSFLPLRQVLDGRVQRRLRRNGLSEEMNSVYAEKAEKKKRAAAAEAELHRLRADVAARDELILHLQNGGDDTIVQDNDRVMALQREVNMLRRQLASNPDVDEEHTATAQDAHNRTHNWTLAARDPFGSTISADFDDDFANFDDDMTEAITDAADVPNTPDVIGVIDVIDVDGADLFGDATMAELQCSTPSRRGPRRQHTVVVGKHDSQQTISFAQSFPTPPATSPVAWTDEADVGMPAAPATPVTPSLHHFSTRRVAFASSSSSSSSPSPSPPSAQMVDTDVQAELPDPVTEQLRDQVADLLRALADKTAALEMLSKGLQDLSPQEGEADESGTPPMDASDIVRSLAAAFRTARLELEYLTPGEIELPLTAPAAAVLDLLLSRLRALSQQAQAADVQIDEYHALEGDLRQQLGARVQAMDDLAREAIDKDQRVATLETAITAHEATITDLHIGADRFKGALASYARDVAELEALVGRLEADLKEKDASLKEKDASLKEKDASLKEKDASLKEKDAKLVEVTTAARSAAATHGQALALRDARVHELRGEIEERDTALRSAQRRGHESARQLREDNAALQTRLEAETQRATAAKAAVVTLQVLLDGPTEGPAATENRREKRLSLGRRLFGRRSGSAGASTDAAAPTSTEGTTETTPASTEATPRTTKKRRRYDSGLGFLDEEEVEAV